MFQQTKIPCVGSEITFSVISQGDDLCVTIAGGEKPHIGAVALAQVRPSLADASKRSASVSVLTLLGHKEDMLARDVAYQIAVACGHSVVVSCGIHMDQATVAQLQEIDQVVHGWCDTFASQFGKVS